MKLLRLSTYHIFHPSLPYSSPVAHIPSFPSHPRLITPSLPSIPFLKPSSSIFPALTSPLSLPYSHPFSPFCHSHRSHSSIFSLISITSFPNQLYHLSRLFPSNITSITSIPSLHPFTPMFPMHPYLPFSPSIPFHIHHTPFIPYFPSSPRITYLSSMSSVTPIFHTLPSLHYFPPVPSFSFLFTIPYFTLTCLPPFPPYSPIHFFICLLHLPLLPSLLSHYSSTSLQYFPSLRPSFYPLKYSPLIFPVILPSVCLLYHCNFDCTRSLVLVYPLFMVKKQSEYSDHWVYRYQAVVYV